MVWLCRIRERVYKSPATQCLKFGNGIQDKHESAGCGWYQSVE